MPVEWTDFEQCVKERIAYYQQQYDQASRLYLMVQQGDNGRQEELTDILSFQRLLTEELTRLYRLLYIYSPTARAGIPDRRMVLIGPARLN